MIFYSVTTTLTLFGPYRNVRVFWANFERRDPRCYAGLKLDDGSVHGNEPDPALDECFTADEANRLKEFLDRSYSPGSPTVIEPLPVPVPHNIVPQRMVPFGWPEGWIDLTKTESGLGFHVEGYFDLRDAEVDEARMKRMEDEPEAFGEAFNACIRARDSMYDLVASVDWSKCSATIPSE